MHKDMKKVNDSVRNLGRTIMQELRRIWEMAKCLDFWNWPPPAGVPDPIHEDASGRHIRHPIKHYGPDDPLPGPFDESAFEDSDPRPGRILDPRAEEDGTSFTRRVVGDYPGTVRTCTSLQGIRLVKVELSGIDLEVQGPDGQWSLLAHVYDLDDFGQMTFTVHDIILAQRAAKKERAS